MRPDFLTDADGDLLIRDGDFVISEGIDQHTKTIMYATKGEIRQYPTLGVGLVQFLGTAIDNYTLEMYIKSELNRDDITLESIDITSTDSDITADVIVN